MYIEFEERTSEFKDRTYDRLLKVEGYRKQSNISNIYHRHFAFQISDFVEIGERKFRLEFIELQGSVWRSQGARRFRPKLLHNDR
jgi:hypothetical protein